MSSPARLADARLGDTATPTETFGTRRLDLRTPESPVGVEPGTPAPLTAGHLASVRREAGASRYSDGRDAPGRDHGWDSWTEGEADTDHRMARLDDDLDRRRTSIGRAAARLLGGSRKRQTSDRVEGD